MEVTATYNDVAAVCADHRNEEGAEDAHGKPGTLERNRHRQDPRAEGGFQQMG